MSPRCLVCEAIKQEMELSIAAPLIDIYIQEASPFCVAKVLQGRIELATEIVLCFLALCVVRALHFAGWKMEKGGKDGGPPPRHR